MSVHLDEAMKQLRRKGLIVDQLAVKRLAVEIVRRGAQSE